MDQPTPISPLRKMNNDVTPAAPCPDGVGNLKATPAVPVCPPARLEDKEQERDAKRSRQEEHNLGDSTFGTSCVDHRECAPVTTRPVALGAMSAFTPVTETKKQQIEDNSNDANLESGKVPRLEKLEVDLDCCHSTFRLSNFAIELWGKEKPSPFPSQITFDGGVTNREAEIGTMYGLHLCCSVCRQVIKSLSIKHQGKTLARLEVPHEDDFDERLNPSYSRPTMDEFVLLPEEKILMACHEIMAAKVPHDGYMDPDNIRLCANILQNRGEDKCLTRKEKEAIYMEWDNTEGSELMYKRRWVRADRLECLCSLIEEYGNSVWVEPERAHQQVMEEITLADEMLYIYNLESKILESKIKKNCQKKRGEKKRDDSGNELVERENNAKRQRRDDLTDTNSNSCPVNLVEGGLDGRLRAPPNKTEIFDIQFDHIVDANLKSIKDEELQTDTIGKTKETSISPMIDAYTAEDAKGSIAIKRALVATFGDKCHSTAANYLLEYLRKKLYLGNGAVKVFLDDEELRNGLLEWNNVTELPRLTEDDFLHLFLFHVAPSRFYNHLKKAREKQSEMVELLKESSKRMFDLAKFHLKETKLGDFHTSNSMLHFLNGMNYRQYDTPSKFSFRERYDMHLHYLRLRPDLNPGITTYAFSKYIPELQDLSQRKKQASIDANNPLLLLAAASVAEGLNMPVTNSQAGIDDRQEIATAECTQLLEEIDSQPNNRFVNQLLHKFSDSFLDRRWRIGENRPITSVSQPVEYTEGKLSYVFSAENAISEDLVHRLIKELGRNEEVQFIYPKAKAGGRTGSYMRMAFRDGGDSVTDPQDTNLSFRPFFLIGNECLGCQKLYVGVKAVDLEVEIMDMLERLLRPIIDEIYGKDFPFAVEMLQHVISHCNPYGDHNDNNKNTTSTGEGDPYRTRRGSKLPTEKQSITATICFEERHSGEPLYTVSWKKNDEVVCIVKVGPRAIHIQLPGMNDVSMKHGVHVNPTLIQTLGWRWVISARLLIFPLDTNLEAYKKHLTDKTKEMLQNPEKMQGAHPDSLVTAPLKYFSGEKQHQNKPGEVKPVTKTAAKAPTNQRLDLSLFKNSAKFEQCSYEYVQKHFPDLVNLPRKMKHQLKPSILSSCYPQLRGLVRDGIVPVINRSERIEKKEGDKVKTVTTVVEYWPLFCFVEHDQVHFPRKFGKYSEEVMRNNAKIKWRAKDKDKYPMCSCKDDNLIFKYSVFFAYRNYKQDYASLIAFILGFIDFVKMIGSGGSPGTSGNNLNLKTADDPRSAAHGHSSCPQLRNDMNTTLDQASLLDKVVTIFISHDVHQQIVAIVNHLSREELDDNTKEYYNDVLLGVGYENRGSLPSLLQKKGIPTEIGKNECLCLGTFFAQSNDIETGWDKKKINSVFCNLPKRDFPLALFRESKFRAPKYKEVDSGFYKRLPYLDEAGQMVNPKKPLRKWIINDDCCEPIYVYVKDKRQFKSTLFGSDHLTGNDIWHYFERELAKDDHLPLLNQETEDCSDSGNSKENGDMEDSGDKDDDDGVSSSDSDDSDCSDSDSSSGSDVGVSSSDSDESDSSDSDSSSGSDASDFPADLDCSRLMDSSTVYADRKLEEGKVKDKISLSSFELVRTMIVMSAADSMRAGKECFAWIREKNDKEEKLKATPLSQYELGTVVRMFPNPNPSRVTNVKSDTLVQTILPDKHANGSCVCESQPRNSYPLKQRLRLANSEITHDFANNLFKCIVATVISNPAATGMYQKECEVEFENAIPGLDNLDSYLRFVKESRRCGSKWAHHQHGQFTEAIPEKVREDFGSFETFVDNLSHNFFANIQRIYEESKNKDEFGSKPDRGKVLYGLADLFTASCSSTEWHKWVFIASEVLKEVDELYEEEPLGEANPGNQPVAYGSKTGVTYWNRPTENNPRPNSSRRKQKRKHNSQKGEGGKEKEVEVFFLADVITEEQGKELFQEVRSLNETELAALLYYRDDCGVVRSMYNGREFGWIDVEHWLVSLAMLMVFSPFYTTSIENFTFTLLF